MGLEKAGNTNSNNNVFERPSVGVLVVVDGERPLVEEEWTPFLKTLHKFNSPAQSVKEVLNFGTVRKAKNLAGKAFVLASSHVENEHEEVEGYWRVSGNGVEQMLSDARQNSGKHLVLLKHDQQRLPAEIGLVQRLVADQTNNKDARPAIVFAEVFGLENRNSQQRSSSFAELSAGLESIASKLASSTSRPLFTIVFTEKKQGPAPMILTEVQLAESRRLQSVKQPFQGSDYVIMFWTLVFLMILTFFVICCIPWAPTLDPALRSTLKQDNKRD
jgi:hypothetical protein